jgi:hypothetical protein
MRGSPFASNNLSEAVSIEKQFRDHLKRIDKAKGGVNLNNESTMHNMIEVRKKHATSTRFRKVEQWREQDKEHNRLISKFKIIAAGAHLSVEPSGVKQVKDET